MPRWPGRAVPPAEWPEVHRLSPTGRLAPVDHAEWRPLNSGPHLDIPVSPQSFPSRGLAACRILLSAGFDLHADLHLIVEGAPPPSSPGQRPTWWRLSANSADQLAWPRSTWGSDGVASSSVVWELRIGETVAAELPRAFLDSFSPAGGRSLAWALLVLGAWRTRADLDEFALLDLGAQIGALERDPAGKRHMDRAQQLSVLREVRDLWPLGTPPATLANFIVAVKNGRRPQPTDSLDFKAILTGVQAWDGGSQREDLRYGDTGLKRRILSAQLPATADAIARLYSRL